MRDGVDVFLYLDYRQFLRDYYADRRQHGRISHRSFSQRAGLRSPNYLKLVMDGARNLGRETIPRFAKACGLTGPAATYFAQLVAYNQAQSPEERSAAYATLKRLAGHQDVRLLTVAQDMYHSRWYLPVIRELVATQGFREDPEWIASQLLPPIRTHEAAQALHLLVELGLLERDEQGRLGQVDATVSTDDAVRSAHLRTYHRTMIAHALSSYDRLPKSARSISAITFTVDEGGIERLRTAVAEIRRDLLKAAEAEPHPRRVVQMNFQIFAVSELQEPEPEG